MAKATLSKKGWASALGDSPRRSRGVRALRQRPVCKRRPEPFAHIWAARIMATLPSILGSTPDSAAPVAQQAGVDGGI
uniref:Uncharacterized protein n=1 Tax=Pseudomonas syringae pv. actinidiae TaxID=103796 RepID=A0A2P0QH71_PSESF|nr:hypothetical protein [Pseudomonas syringae pv. actinidiae]